MIWDICLDFILSQCFWLFFGVTYRMWSYWDIWYIVKLMHSLYLVFMSGSVCSPHTREVRCLVLEIHFLWSIFSIFLRDDEIRCTSSNITDKNIWNCVGRGNIITLESFAHLSVCSDTAAHHCYISTCSVCGGAWTSYLCWFGIHHCHQG